MRYRIPTDEILNKPYDLSLDGVTTSVEGIENVYGNAQIAKYVQRPQVERERGEKSI